MTTILPGLNRPMTPKSQRLYLDVLRHLGQWLAKKRVVRFNPMDGIRGPKLRQGFRRGALTVEQVQRVLETFDVTSPQGLRDKALVYLMLKTGIREISVSRAIVGDYRAIPEGWVLLIQGKGRVEKDEFVVLVDEVKALLDHYVAARGPVAQEDPLFLTMGIRAGHPLSTRTIRSIITTALRMAGVKTAATPQITGHSLRHTAASMALHGGAPLTAVKDMLHHSSITQTNQYLHTIQRVREGGEQFITQY